MYSGRCKHFRYKNKLTSKEYFTFKATNDFDGIIDIYFIQEGKAVKLSNIFLTILILLTEL